MFCVQSETDYPGNEKKINSLCIYLNASSIANKNPLPCDSDTILLVSYRLRQTEPFLDGAEMASMAAISLKNWPRLQLQTTEKPVSNSDS